MNDEPIALTQEINDLRERVLRGEDVSPEQYHEVLLAVRKLRRDRPEKASKEPKAPVDVQAILFGKGGGQ